MNTEEDVLKYSISLLKAEERNLTIVIRGLQTEILNLTSDKKKVVDSTEALKVDKEAIASEYAILVKKNEDIKSEIISSSKLVDEATVEANKIRSDISSERAKIDVERVMLEQEKEAHQVEKSNLADDKRDFQTKVEKLNKALE